MSAFLTDTLVWTGALLALVLIFRRPVASLLGPQAAYVLWALPMARLLLPPLTLPAWLAPGAPAAEAVTYIPATPLETIALDGPIVPVVIEPTLDWMTVLMAVWLSGAAIFLIRRYALYFAMRRTLLRNASPVGEAGRVRLVETSAVEGPVAFGVIDKVVALPAGFMAAPDRMARDLALAHELAHHRGHDLLCNMLVQPLFALHWFSPLATLGWRALRRDQEAACDARVVAAQPRAHRAAYAQVIARFATQSRDAGKLALAAPMACPALGDRSIVQRLRSLAKAEISPRRRWTGRILLTGAALALPLTASITYAQGDGDAAPATVPMPPPAPLLPGHSTPPRVTVGKDGKTRVIHIERMIANENGSEDGSHRMERRILVSDGAHLADDERAEIESEMHKLGSELRHEQGELDTLHRELDRELGEHSELQKELRATFGSDGSFTREIRVAVAEASRAGAIARAVAVSTPRVSARCREGQRDVSETVVERDGRQHIYVCNSLATVEARRALAIARGEIARSRDLSATQRAEALRALAIAEQESRAD